VNVRLIAATNRDIIEAIKQNEFREDLFHRLNVVQFALPPLRDRGQDILMLADHFLKHFAPTMRKAAKRISRAAQQKLATHHWPGNVRELRNVIERALILEKTDEIQPASLPDFGLETGLRKGTTAPRTAVGENLDEMMANFERDLISGVLEQNHYSLTKTAEHLKISRHALRYRMQRLNISLEGEPEEEPAARSPKEGAA
jgi:DNA-binding NtrC family response regulator